MVSLPFEVHAVILCWQCCRGQSLDDTSLFCWWQSLLRFHPLQGLLGTGNDALSKCCCFTDIIILVVVLIIIVANIIEGFVDPYC